MSVFSRDELQGHQSQQDSPDEKLDTELADDLRTQSFHLMGAHPIAAAHLVLAAASIAPTCPDEQDVAESFSYVIIDFAKQLSVLHSRAISRQAKGE